MQRHPTSLDRARRGLLAAGGAWAAILALKPHPALAQAAASRTRIGIIGAGRIGGAIGALWIKAGHPVMFSSRHPEELKDLAAGLGGTGLRRS